MWWTDELYDRAYDKVKDKKYPIFIPSYNRPNPITVSELLKMDNEYNYPIFLIVRQSQKDNYINSNENKYVKIISVEDNLISNSGLTRNMCVSIASNMGFKKIFMFDDDIKSIGYLVQGHTKSGDLKSDASKSDNISKIIAMWQYAMEIASNKYNVALSSVGFRSNSWTADKCIKSNAMKLVGGHVGQVCCIDINKFNMLDINYRDNKICGHEDTDIEIRLIKEKIPTCIFQFLDCEATSMSSDNWGYDNMVARLKSQYDIMFNNFKDLGFVKFFEDKRGLSRVSLNWIRARKYLGIGNYVIDIFSDL